MRCRASVGLAGLSATAVAVAAVVAAAPAAPTVGDLPLLGRPARLAAVARAAADGRVFTLRADCDDGCQERARGGLAAAGCTGIVLLRALRMATATCAAAGGGDVAAAAEARLADIPGVTAVERDGLMRVEEEGEGGADELGEGGGGSRRAVWDDIPLTHPVTGKPYFWGLDRINQYNLPFDFNRMAASCYAPAGEGVVVFVVDSGCATEHPQFGGRATTLALPGSPFPPSGRDDRGHGSHVAGTVGGVDTGVAPRVRLVCVKVNDRHGENIRSDAIAGFDYVAAYKAAHPDEPVILQASFHDDAHTLDVVAERVAAAGVIPVVSAGNAGGDACDYSPGNTDHVLTVANADADDTVVRSSNTGPCVDVIAPGRKTLSVDYRGGLRTMTGTSMSAPTVSGVVAVLLSITPNAGRVTVADMRAALTMPAAPRIGGIPLAWLDPSCPTRPSLPGAVAPTPVAAPAPVGAPTPTPTVAPSPTATPEPNVAPTPTGAPVPTAAPIAPPPCVPVGARAWPGGIPPTGRWARVAA